MKSLFNEQSRKKLVGRINSLSEQDLPQFGSMSPAHALCHMADSLRSSKTKEHEALFKPSFFSSKLGQWLIISSPIPWPKGKIKIQPKFENVFLATKPSEDFEQDKQSLIEEIELFAINENGDWPIHPLFGDLGASLWSRLQYRHIGHHLSQFGR